VLDAWERAHLARAARALAAGASEAAVDAVERALGSPANLGEARHPLANTAGLHLLLGDALAAAGRPVEAGAAWSRAASFTGDFLGMSPRAFSDRSVHSVEALLRLGRRDDALKLYDRIVAWLESYAATPAAVDFFATSLPTMLLFVDDPRVAREAEVRALREHLTAIGTWAPTQPQPIGTERRGTDAVSYH
jgi:tetratricopeptide (TPR) repeat protein